jgi:hypothetical protein
MLKKNEKSGPVETADSFDDLLAEILTAEHLHCKLQSSAKATSNSSCAHGKCQGHSKLQSSAKATSSESAIIKGSYLSVGVEARPRKVLSSLGTPTVEVSEEDVIAACRRGDTAQLRQWGRQGALFHTITVTLLHLVTP